MRRCLTRVLLAVSSFVCVFGTILQAEELRFVTREAGPASLKRVLGIPVITLKGNSQAIGAQEATLMKEVAEPILQFPKIAVEQNGGGFLWPAMATVSRKLFKNAPSQFGEEIDSLIAAGPYDADALYIGNAFVELRRLGGCSAFVVMPQQSATDGMLFGRNFDFPPFGVLDKLGCVKVVHPEGKHKFLSIGFPGLIGVVSGMNDAGLSVATLDVYASNDKSKMFDPHGVQLALTFRRILEECKTVDEAYDLLASVKRTTWMNLVVCDRDTAKVFEITPKNIGVRDPNQGCLACTNHFRTDKLSVEKAKECDRFQKLTKRAGAEKHTLADVQAALHSVHQGPLTIQTMIFEPATLKVHLVMGTGPISDKPLVTLSLADF